MYPRRPSPATVLSALALFFALGGTAIAARHYLITSTSQIKPAVLKKLHGAAGPTGPQGPQGPQGSSGAQGPAGAPGAPATTLWASVTATGSLVISSGVTGISTSYGDPYPPAWYILTFNRNVSQCARVATLSSSSEESGEEPGQIAISNSSLRNPDTIEVYTYNAGGTAEYRSFSVAVFC